MQVLGTYLGTELGTLLGSGPDSELAALEYYLARNLFSWIRADYRTLVDYGGGDVRVSAFPDKVALVSEGAVAPNARSVDPEHAFAQGTQASQIAATAPHVAFGGCAVGAFTGAQRYASTIAGSNWNFNHNGSGATQWHAWCPTSNAATQALTATSGSIIGANLYWALSGTSVRWQTGNASIFISPTAAAKTFALNAPTWTRCSYVEGASPEFLMSERNVAAFWSGNSGAAPSANNAFAMTIGDIPTGGLAANALVAECMFASRVDAALDAYVSRYMFLRYGLA